jgi:hypothetical protein
VSRALQLMLPGGPISISETLVVNSTTNFPQINFNSDGTTTYKSNGIDGFFFPRGWYRAAGFNTPVTGIGAAYEIRLTPTAGAFGLELENTWVTLATGTSWNRISGNGTSSGLIEIRDATTDVVLGSCTITLNDN